MAATPQRVKPLHSSLNQFDSLQVIEYLNKIIGYRSKKREFRSKHKLNRVVLFTMLFFFFYRNTHIMNNIYEFMRLHTSGPETFQLARTRLEQYGGHKFAVNAKSGDVGI